MSEVRQLSVSDGLWSFRQRRLEFLESLGTDQCDVATSGLGPIRVWFITSANIAREVMIRNAEKFVRGPAIAKHARPFLGDGLLSAHGESHKRQRKLLSPKFQPRHIGHYAAVMVDSTETMLAQWRETTPTDFADEMFRMTMDTASRTMFGTVPGGDLDELTEALEFALEFIMRETVSLVHWPRWLPTPSNRKVKRAVGMLDRIVAEMIAEHRQAGADRDDVLSVLMDARDEDDGTGLSDELIRDEVVTFFVAGHETTANALSWAYPLLATHPAIAATLQREVDDAVGDDPLTAAALDKLPFARQVFDEVLRLYPTVYMVGRQATEALSIADLDIGARDYLVMNFYGMHRRADYFEDPLAFRPERFAEPAWPKHAYLPFGLGPRVCIGNHFAAMQGVLTLAALARAIHFRGDHDFVAEPLITLRAKHGVPFTPSWREDA